MKFLILIAVILLVLWVLRSARRSRKPREDAAQGPAAPAREPLPQDMVRCPVCAVHLPRGDAVADQRGLLYCCAEHRHKAGG
jgi:uncharacterized protein